MPNSHSLIYLDHAAATPLDPGVSTAMQPYLTEHFVNPSSVYVAARLPRTALEAARASIADLIGARATEIVFTSGTTESDNAAITGALRARRGLTGSHWVTSAVEHDAVLAQVQALEADGFQSTVVPVEPTGIIDLERLLQAITDETVMVSVMLANNEIGTIQPVRELAGRLTLIRRERQRRGIKTPLYLHSDVAQALNYLPVKVETLGVDLMSFGGSKLYGPRGIGVLYVRTGCKLAPLIYGGGQERGRRSGTENVAGAVGLAAALKGSVERRAIEVERLRPLRDQLTNGILRQIPGSLLNGDPTRRLANNVNVTITGAAGETLVLYLDQAGIMASTGSACASGSLDPSHVLQAIGRSRSEAESSLRFSLGRSTDAEAIAAVLRALPPIVERVRRLG